MPHVRQTRNPSDTFCVRRTFGAPLSKLERTKIIERAEVQLKVVKPATAQNKETSLTVSVPGQTLFVEKTCDTFEEGVDLCVDAMKVQLTKFKEKARKM